MRRTEGRPFLKWAGGKRWMVKEIAEVAPSNFHRYFEPFLGGGAFFFENSPWPATLSDINEELINLYRMVRDDVDGLISRLRRLRIDKSTFSDLRNRQCQLPITRAVRMLYLNRTAFNGLYRVNQKGVFNVPFGCKPGTAVCDCDNLRRASEQLQNRSLTVCDFETSFASAKPGDFIFADPPYTTFHDNNGFRRYNEVLFSWADQLRLAESTVNARRRGVHVVVANANHPSIRELYSDFSVSTVLRFSRVSAQQKGRSRVTECLFH